jgi:itaconyl-CoA hydratase
MTAGAFMTRAVLKAKGHRYEDFEIGRRFEHHWGRTLNHGDNSLFTALTLHFNPLYTNAEFAKAHGHPDVVINPMLVFTTVFGLTVEDLSEGGGAFLGVEALTFVAPVYPGDTLTAASAVVERRLSASNSSMGIVTWHTQGFNQHGVRVIDFRRTNLINRQDAT